MDHLWGVLIVTLWCSVLPSMLQVETMDEYCERAFVNVSFRQCCDIPRFLPAHAIDLCRQRPMPPVPPGVPEPIPENCLAECTLNVTRVLMDFRFRVDQARKVLLARSADDTAWAQTIGAAIEKCYRMRVVNSFHLQDVAQNRISTQCLPSSLAFLECTLAMTYRNCPVQYWNDPNETCYSLVQAFNNCSFFFRGKIDI